MKKIGLGLALLLSIVWATIPYTSLAQATDEAVVRAVLFYSPTCSHCHYVITEVLMPMTEEYGDRLQIVGLDTTQSSGAYLYQKAVDHFQIPPERKGVPTLIVGDVVLVGSGEIPEQFPAMVEEILAAGGIGWPDIPDLAQALSSQPETDSPQAAASPATATPQPTVVATPISARVEPSDETVYLAYFFDPTCLECGRVSAELANIQARYPNLIIKKFDINQEAALNEAMCEKYGLPAEYRLMAPIIFIGDQALTPNKLTTERLEALIANPDRAAADPPWAGLEQNQAVATTRIVERFKQFGLLAVAVAGLLDGVNPCAFTTIIFFVSYLTLVGRKGREILWVGAAFTLAVFLTYLAMGLGLAEVVRHISSFALIGRLIYGLTALACLVLAVMSLGDYLKIRQGRLTDLSLQLPKALKRRIHDTIRTHSRMRGYIGAAFGAGALVSLFELACTGQVYLPTIVFVTGVADLRWLALAYLLLYNLMFIIPLIAVFTVAYLGMSNRQLTTLFQSNAGAVKLLTALLFGVLAVWLGYIVWII